MIYFILLVVVIFLYIIIHDKKIKQQQKERDEAYQQKIALEKQLQKKHEDEAIKNFNFLLEAIPQKEIQLNNEADHKRQNMISYPNIKLTNITKKTPLHNMLDYVVIDIETTGIKTGGNRIIEFSAIRFIDFYPAECISTLINPKMSIPSEATVKNGITDNMVVDAPEFYQIKDCFVDFIGNSPIVGHNIVFDLRHLYASGLDLTSTKKIYDTYSLSKSKLKDCYYYSLNSLCSYFDIYRDNSHRALSDCLASGILFKKIVKATTDDLKIFEFEQILNI